MNKVLIVDGSSAYFNMFKNKGWEVVFNIFEADLVQFTGGEDVSPEYYGEVKHPSTYSSTYRDATELDLYEACKELGVCVAGICRGGQFLHVCNGGSMWQDVKGHAIRGTHPAIDLATGVAVEVTSTHHQMMRENDCGELIMVGAHNPSLIKEHMAEGEIEACECDVDVEAVYYADTKTFCFQPHPEMFGAEQTNAYYFNKLNQLFGLE